MTCKLNILEPWEYGTLRPIDAVILAQNRCQYLIMLFEPRAFGEVNASHLMGELRDKSAHIDLLLPGLQGAFAMNLVFSAGINEQNFPDLSIKDFRNNFLLGEIVV